MRRVKRNRLQRKLMIAVVAACFTAELAYANPSGPAVANGQASFASQGAVLSVTHTPGAIINWQQFSIQANETTRFIQQSAASAVLNRVVGANPSSILGTLQSNGRVFLINPNGIVFGAGSRVDVAGLVASSLNLSNEDFLAGRLNFVGDPNSAAAIINQGRITAAAGGNVYLVGAAVDNQGVISAAGGDVVLAAGKSVRVTDSVTAGLQVEITAPAEGTLNLSELGNRGMYAGLIINRGVISADSVVRGVDGRILLKASGGVTLEAGSLVSASGAKGGSIAIESAAGLTQLAGTIAATGNGMNGNDGGAVSIKADVLIHTGTTDASGAAGGSISIETNRYLGAGTLKSSGLAGDGGAVSILAHEYLIQTSGESVTADGAAGAGGSITLQAAERVFSSAALSAQGTAQRGGDIKLLADEVMLYGATINASGERGGTVLIGGDYQGGNAAIPNASRTWVNYSSVITADAREHGAGGKVILWADNDTRYAGHVSARGGALSGAGGFIEVSGRDTLVFAGTADASAAHGASGTLLLDPKNIIIDSAGGPLSNPLLFSDQPANNVMIAPAQITAITDGGTAVVLQANNDITLAASSDIVTSASGAGGAITMQAGRSILLNSSITTDNGALTLTANETAANGVVDANRDAGAAAITMAAGTTLNAGSANITITLSTGAGLTNATSSAITLENLTTSGHVLVANHGPSAGSDILRVSSNSLVTANSAAFDVNGAGGGGAIGTAGNPMRVTVSNLEARSQSAGAFFASFTQGATIGGASLGGLSGISTSANGDIAVAAAGTLTVSEAISAHGTGTAMLTATGGGSNITTSAAIGSGSGSIALLADNDITLNSGGTVGAATTGAITISADNDASGAGILTTGAAIGNASAAGTITLSGYDMALGANVTGSGALTIKPSTASRDITIGADNASDFALNPLELSYPADGFDSITIGRISDGTGIVSVFPSTFRDPLTVAGGSLVFGRQGSRSFNGSSDYVSAPTTKTSTATFSLWASATTPLNSVMLFVAGPDGVGPDLFFYNGLISWNTWNAEANAFGAIPANAADGNFHHYVVVVEPGNTKLFYDGALLGTAAYADPSATPRFDIGGASSYLWRGNIANVQIFNRALLVPEISQIRASPGGVTSGVALYLPLGGASPESDYSGNGNAGTLVGTTPSLSAPPVAILYAGANPVILIARTGSIQGSGTATDVASGALAATAVTGIGNTTQLVTSGLASGSAATSGAGAAAINIANTTASPTTLSSLVTVGANAPIAFAQSGGGALVVTAAATTDGAITLSNAGANLTATNLSAGGSSNNVVTLITTSSGDIVLTGMNTAVQGLTVSSAGTASLPAFTTREGGINVAATTITLNGDLSTNAGATAGPVNLTGAVTLAANVAITADIANPNFNAVLANIALGGAIGVAITPDGTTAYVANYPGHNVSVVNLATNTVTGSIPIGSISYVVALTPDGSRAYVSAFDTNSVVVIDTRTNAVIKTITVGTNPVGLAISPDGTRAYVTNYGENTISIINTANNTVAATVTVGAVPYGVAIARDGTRAYVTNYGADTVSVIDTATQAVTATIAVNNPSGVAVAPNGERVYVTNYAQDTVSVINTLTNSIVAIVPAGTTPLAIAVAPDGSRVYVSNSASSTVSVIDANSNAVTSTIAVALGSYDVAFSPDGTRLYVPNFIGGSVSVIDAKPGANGANVTITGTTDADSAGNNRTLALASSGGAINLTQAAGGSQALQSLSVNRATSVELPAITTRSGGIDVRGTNIALKGNLATNSTATAGNITLVGAVALKASPTITTDAATTDANIVVDGTLNADAAGNNRDITVTAGSGTVILPSAVGATQPVNTFTVTSAANAYLPAITTRSGGIDVSATHITLNGNLATNTMATAGAVVLTGAVLLGNNVAIDSDADITIIGTTDADLVVNSRTLTLNAGIGGSVALSGAVGANQSLGALSVTNSNALSLAGVTTSGNVLGNAQNALMLNGAIDAGPGTVSLAANKDGAGAQGFIMAAGSSITTTNATSGAVRIDINAAAGGTGAAALRDITAGAGGEIMVATHTGANATGGAITQTGALSATQITLGTGAGDITLDGTITASGAGDSIVLAAGGNFINHTGASALAPGAGRWLVYSTNPALDTRGGLAYNFKQYNAPYGASVLGSGNGFLYGLASPSITAGLGGTVSKVYDGTTIATLAAGNYFVSGAIDGDTVTLDNPASGSYDTRDVGSLKNISVSGLTIAGVSNAGATVYGYQLASTSANANIGTISARPLTIASQAGQSKTYGNDDPNSAKSAYALAGGTTLGAGDSVSGNMGRSSGEAVGNYPYTVGSVAVSDGNSGGNYSLTFDGTTHRFQINPAALSGTFANQSKVYGADDPSFAGIAVTLGGVVNRTVVDINGNSTPVNDTGNVAASVASLARTAGESVAGSPYSITSGTLNALSGSAAGNYSATLITAGNSLAIAPAALSIRADDTSRVQDTANPPFTATYTGFKFGETAAALGAALSLTTPAILSSPVGTYAITPSGQTSSNYAILYIDGTLTIGVVPIVGVTPIVAGPVLPQFTASSMDRLTSEVLVGMRRLGAADELGIGDVSEQALNCATEGNPANRALKGVAAITPRGCGPAAAAQVTENTPLSP